MFGTSLLKRRSLGHGQERVCFERWDAVDVRVLVAAGAEALVARLAVRHGRGVLSHAPVAGDVLGLHPRRARDNRRGLDPALVL